MYPKSEFRADSEFLRVRWIQRIEKERRIRKRNEREAENHIIIIIMKQKSSVGQ